MKTERSGPDEPLTATLTFVLVMGFCFFLGWMGLFLLLKDRW